MSNQFTRSLANKIILISIWLGFTKCFLEIPVAAQIVPDATLQNNSQVQVDGQTIEITGGTQNGTNLFHSFQEFSLPTGNTAYFNNALNIENIFSRVTGSSISNIDGLIQANGIANLFLINPNGIFFGANARLNIGGSFLGSTAESLVWPDDISWNASNPNPAPLLNINVPIGLQLGANPGEIVVEGTPIEQTISSNITTPEDLQSAIDLQQNALQNSNGIAVQTGKTLAFVGANITLNSGVIKSIEGRIELGSVQSESQVGIAFNNSDSNAGFILDYETIKNLANFGEIQILDQALVLASGERGGDIQIVGKNLLVTNGSQIGATTLGDRSGGNINIHTSDSIQLMGTSPNLQNANLLGAATYGSGNAGNLTIETGQLILRDGSTVGAGTFAAGDAGQILVNASEFVDIRGIGTNSGSPIAAISHGTGDAGDVTIETGQLILRDGGQIAVSSESEGNAGNIIIRAAEKVELIGATVGSIEEVPPELQELFIPENETNPTTILLPTIRADTSGSGNAGNVEIETREFIVRDGGGIFVGTFGDGEAGNLTIQASESLEVGGTTDPQLVQGLNASSFGGGKAGDVTIDTARFIVRDAGQVRSSSFGAGDGGQVSIRATDTVDIIGTTSNGEFPSSIVSATTQGTGNAGNVIIATRQLTIRDGALVTVNTQGEGNGGNLTIRAAETVEVIGRSPNGQIRSALGAQTNGSGNAGNLTIETGQLIIRDGAGVGAESFAAGDGGEVMIRASEAVEISGIVANGDNPRSVLGASTAGTGNAGNVTIETGQVIVRDGSQITVETDSQSEGNAGNLTIRATEKVEVIGRNPVEQIPSELAADTEGIGNAGNITIETGQLIVRDGAQVTLETTNQGDAGTLFIRATDKVEAIGAPLTPIDRLPPVLADTILRFANQNQVNPTTAQEATIRAETIGSGDAGNIRIETRELILREGGGIFVGTFSDGQAGNLTIQASEAVEITGSFANPLSIQGLGAASFGSGDAGDVTIDTARLIVRDGGEVLASTFFDGDGGTLNITASELVEVTGTSPDDGQNGSDLSASTRLSGNAGNIILNTDRLFVTDRGNINVSGQGTGNPGILEINANGIFVDRGSLSATSATGRGGNIGLQAPDIQLRRGSNISASGSTGTITLDGNINLNTEILVLLEGSQIITDAADPRGGSNIAISASDGENLSIFLSPDSLINARGELQIDTELDLTQLEIPHVEVTDVTQLISRGCEAIAQGSQFTVTGRGGLPPTPMDLVSPPLSMLQWMTREELMFSDVNPEDSVSWQLPKPQSDRQMGDRIIEATGAIVTEDGTVRLVADAVSEDAGNLNPMQHPNCR